MNGQLTFDFLGPPPPEKPKARHWKECPELEKYAFLYTCGESGNVSGIRFMMTLEDAQKWCSSELSKGVLHGNKWAYFYTTVKNFCTCHWSETGEKIDLSNLYDNGSYDEKIKSLGLTKFNKWEIQELLAPFGVPVMT